MRRMLVVFVVMSAVAGTACSSGGGGDEGDGSDAPAGCTADNAVDLTGDDPFSVTIKDRAFTPDCFLAKSASSITVDNQDTVTHTFTMDGTPVDVSIDSGQSFDGASAGLAPGTYAFHCTIHPSMTGTAFVS